MPLTPEDIEYIHELVARTRREQGLPPCVEDPATLARIAELLDK